MVSVPAPVSVATNYIPVTLPAKMKSYFVHHGILYLQKETVEVRLWDFLLIAVVESCEYIKINKT